VKGAIYCKAVRAVVGDSGCVALAYSDGPDNINCLEASISPPRHIEDEPGAAAAIRHVLRGFLLDGEGRVLPNADLPLALQLALVGLEAWLALVRPLSLRDIMEAACRRPRATVKRWACQRPKTGKG
jgi:hypothetical protein